MQLCIKLLFFALFADVTRVFAAPAAKPHRGLQGFSPYGSINEKVKKRQIFRELLAPTLGGVVPAAALSKLRLRHNAHDSVGIAAPDGIVFQPRKPDIRPGRLDPEDIDETLTLTLKDHHHPLEATDLNGMLPPQPQPTTYLLRRPSGYAGSSGPFVSYGGDGGPFTFGENHLGPGGPGPFPFQPLLSGGGDTYSYSSFAPWSYSSFNYKPNFSSSSSLYPLHSHGVYGEQSVVLLP